MTIRLVLVDDHVVLRRGLRMLLETEPDLEVVGELDNGLAAAQQTLDYRPDVVLMDLLMPELDGIAATQRLRAQCPQVRVVILSSIDEESGVVAAVRAGASGYLCKNAPVEVLVDTIRTVARGQVTFSPVASARLIRELHPTTDQPERLTARELEVIECVAHGQSNKKIAWNLRISEKTVKSHVSTILGKFGLESRTQAALHATRVGLVCSGRNQPGPGASLAWLGNPALGVGWTHSVLTARSTERPRTAITPSAPISQAAVVSSGSRRA
jgi:NarL family two-component system response regulator LiaR